MRDRSSRAWFHMLIMLVVALAMSSFLSFVVGGAEVSASAIGEVVGGAFAFVVLPALIVGSWKFVQRLRDTQTDVPVFAGWVSFFFVLLFSWTGAEYVATKPLEVVFAPMGCSHQVHFPREPEIKQVLTGKITFDQASVYTQNSMLRVECLQTRAGPPSDADIANSMRAFAEREGLQFPEFSTERRAGALVHVGRGTKTVSGIPATYRFAMVWSKSSLMTLVVGSPSAKFPTKEIERFWASLSERSE